MAMIDLRSNALGFTMTTIPKAKAMIASMPTMILRNTPSIRRKMILESNVGVDDQK